MEKTDHNAHSVYLMYYHLIMVVKYRRKVINDPISERAKEIWELSKFINAYKSASSSLLKEECPEIQEKLWKEAFWSQSFCLLTAGGASVEVSVNTSKPRERKSIEHSILLPYLSNRRTEDTSWKNIWLLPFPVQPDA